jgi:DNA polymerase V
MKITPLCLLHSVLGSPEEVLAILSKRLAGDFYSPENDCHEDTLRLNHLLIKHPAATILARVEGESMIDRGILDGSFLVVDRSITPKNDSTIVASVAGELTVKILDLKRKLLRSANKKYESIPLPKDLDLSCEGVVTFCMTPQKNMAFAC